MKHSTFIFANLLLLASSLTAGELQFSGAAALDLRGFPHPAASGDQLDGEQISFTFGPRVEWSTDDRRDQVRVLGFWRHDQHDDERTHFDLREAYWRRTARAWELLIGYNRVFWGVTESRHLVDIINQADLLEGVDGEIKLGQPMIELSTQRPWGRLSLFVLPGFRERSFPGPRGRLRPLLPVAQEAVYESADGKDHIDFAVRWSHSLGPWDLGVHVFDGTSREPRLVVTGTDNELVPHYDLISQVGLDAQLTRGAWLSKLEVLLRSGHGPSFYGSMFGATVIGFERTTFQVFGTSLDLGVLVEYLRDGRGAEAPPTPFENDLFVGTRLAFNDLQSTSVLAGLTVDLADGSVVYQIEASRRLTETFSIDAEVQWFAEARSSPNLAHLSEDGNLTVSVVRNF